MKFECILCKKETEKRNYNQRFCSIKCKTAFYGTRHKYKIECEYCKKEFNPHRKTQKFCSRQCAVRGRIGKLQRSAHGTNAICGYCGKPIYVQPKRLKAKKVFCDYKCAGAYKRTILWGANNPNYKAIPLKICFGCDKEFKSYDKNRRYCSSLCSQKFSANEAIANLKRGLEAEIECCKYLKKKGYHVSRSAGSKGEYDVIAISEKEILLIQVKCTKSKQLSRIFPKKAIEKLILAKCPKLSIIKKQLWSLVENIGWKIKEI